jgi:hypothetical protein
LLAISVGLMAVSIVLAVGLASCAAASSGDMMGGGMMGGGGMMAGGNMAEPMMVWQAGQGPVASPQAAGQAAIVAVRRQGWDWLTLDEVHIFPAFFEVELNDQGGFKGPEVYVNRATGNAGPEMGPNMMWDTRYGMMGAACGQVPSEARARARVAPPAGLSLGDGERHHGYWEFELKRGGQAVNQVNVEDCGSGVIFEAAWQPDMVGTYAPNG